MISDSPLFGLFKERILRNVYQRDISSLYLGNFIFSYISMIKGTYVSLIGLHYSVLCCYIVPSVNTETRSITFDHCSYGIIRYSIMSIECSIKVNNSRKLEELRDLWYSGNWVFSSSSYLSVHGDCVSIHCVVCTTIVSTEMSIWHHLISKHVMSSMYINFLSPFDLHGDLPIRDLQ